MNSPSAFPLPHVDGQHYARPGMTLRDYFAGKAMATLISVCRPDTRPAGITYEQLVAAHAYDMADAMLKAREAVVLSEEQER